MDVSAILVTEENRIGNISLSFNSRIPRHDVLVVTASDTFEILGTTVTKHDGEVLYDGIDAESSLSNAVYAQDADFVRAIVEGTEPEYTADEALLTIRVIQDIENTRRP
jgi:predicted dehydrogenase